MMSQGKLQRLAKEAFAAIHENTGEEWPHETLQASVESFRQITRTKGLAWLIDSAKGTGMTHYAWSLWMSDAEATVKQLE